MRASLSACRLIALRPAVRKAGVLDIAVLFVVAFVGRLWRRMATVGYRMLVAWCEIWMSTVGAYNSRCVMRANSSALKLRLVSQSSLSTLPSCR